MEKERAGPMTLLFLCRYGNLETLTEQMTELTLEEDETLIIYCKNLSKAKFDIPIFIDVIEAVNEREMNDGHSPQIFLCPIC